MRTISALHSPAERDILLSFKAGITNWDEAAAARNIAGWSACNGSAADQAAGCIPVCNWGGVYCSPFEAQDGDRVTELDLSCDGCPVRLKGRLGAALNNLQYLQSLHLGEIGCCGAEGWEWRS